FELEIAIRGHASGVVLDPVVYSEGADFRAGVTVAALPARGVPLSKTSVSPAERFLVQLTKSNSRSRRTARRAGRLCPVFLTNRWI
ncbi:MAG: hypothetical protein ACRD21_11880, partial [Vicinamibacteria bacterium]